MGQKKRIAIAMGGFSSESGISLKSGEVVYQTLDREHYEPYRVHIRKDGWFLVADTGAEFPVNRDNFSVALNGETLQFDCVFNAIHGTPGEDGLLQAYLELIGIPQTACSSYPAALTFNKRDLLSVVKSYGIPTARSYAVNKGQEIDPDKIFEQVGLPCFVKANRAGSSFGISMIKEKKELAKALEVAFAEDNQVLIEAALVGREVSVGVIRYEGKTRVLPITEIISENDFFDYQAKYEGKSQEITPATLDKEIETRIREMAARIYEILELEGYSRSEFILVDGIPHLLEVNTTPGLTKASILPQQAAADGIGLGELFSSAIEDALAKN